MKQLHLARKYDLSDSYFGVLKKNHPEKHKFIFGFDLNKEKSVESFLNFVQNLIIDIQNIQMQFKNAHEFGKWLCKYNLYSASNFTENSRVIDKVVYSSRRTFLSIQYPLLQKLIKIREIYKSDRQKESKK
ncbi:MAG: hypothetical protein U9N59_05075 [Campylobacterota bacterium]|nr:hypothetical protein [Campylobacterota bacterium]